MVEPMSDEERDAGNRKLQVGFVLLVTVSAGAITLIGDVTTTQRIAVVGGGFLLALALLWYLRKLAAEFQPGGPPRR